MKEVFLVTCGDYSNYSISAAFSSEANALKWIALREMPRGWFQIERWQIDIEPLEK